ncbi:MAG: hypothetical protein K8J08_02135 [Thermoanaerobaculia bacterium]|nr:hypothetical protein [Thermoanaerobaculia bacterium]
MKAPFFIMESRTCSAIPVPSFSHPYESFPLGLHTGFLQWVRSLLFVETASLMTSLDPALTAYTYRIRFIDIDTIIDSSLLEPPGRSNGQGAENLTLNPVRGLGVRTPSVAGGSIAGEDVARCKIPYFDMQETVFQRANP